MNRSKKALVIFSGGMDSSLCLLSAIKKFGKTKVLAVSFSYGQRHSVELKQAKKIAKHFQVDHEILNLNLLGKITHSSLLNTTEKIKHTKGKPPNTMVVGRNGLMLRLASIYAQSKKINDVYMGVIEVEEANSGYRDCSRKYINLIEKSLRLDFGTNDFNVVTPIIKKTKLQTMRLAYRFGELEYLLENTITCYEGIKGYGCGKCPACELRNEGISLFLQEKPNFSFTYRAKFT
ncbi:7-cyano-7-deazaguanine synthase QueC [Bacteriovoracaceae bacterium]|nr:7-cyano-7-deazaguanine synthase QueC [Bacteriovoracaceae bacterium]